MLAQDMIRQMTAVTPEALCKRSWYDSSTIVSLAGVQFKYPFEIEWWGCSGRRQVSLRRGYHCRIIVAPMPVFNSRHVVVYTSMTKWLGMKLTSRGTSHKARPSFKQTKL
jgi:hypothetical protein